jgi:oligopeptidase B
VLAHLHAERVHYEASVDHLSSLRAELAIEQKQRTAADQMSAQWRRGSFVYYTQTPVEEEFERHFCIDLRSGQQFLLLDPHRIAPNATYFAVGVFEPSPDGSMLAYSIDIVGDEVYTLRFRNVATGQDLPDSIERTYYSGAWSADGRTFFYTVHDETYRPDRVMRHRLGEDPARDALVMHEPDRRYELQVEGSRDGGWVIITAQCRDTSEVHLISTTSPEEAPRLVAGRRRGVTYSVQPLPGGWYGNGEDRLLVVTDDAGPEFRLAIGHLPQAGQSGDPETWRTVGRAVRGGERLIGVAVFTAQVVLTLHANAEPYLRVFDRARMPDEQGAASREIHSGLPCGQLHLWHAEDPTLDVITVVEENLITPRRWVEVELATGKRKVVHRTSLSDTDPTAYVTERIEEVRGRRADPGDSGAPS